MAYSPNGMGIEGQIGFLNFFSVGFYIMGLWLVGGMEDEIVRLSRMGNDHICYTPGVRNQSERLLKAYPNSSVFNKRSCIEYSIQHCQNCLILVQKSQTREREHLLIGRLMINLEDCDDWRTTFWKGNCKVRPLNVQCEVMKSNSQAMKRTELRMRNGFIGKKPETTIIFDLNVEDWDQLKCSMLNWTMGLFDVPVSVRHSPTEAFLVGRRSIS